MSSGAGWAGAGLLGAVLAVVFFKIIPGVLAAGEKRTSDLITSFEQQRSKDREISEHQHEAFTANLERIVRHNEAQTKYLAETFARDLRQALEQVARPRGSRS